VCGEEAAHGGGGCSGVALASVRVVTWNVAGRVRRQPEQAAAIAGVGADVVALQEVTARTAPLWRVSLADAGLWTCEDSLGGSEIGGGRRLDVLVAAREPLVRLVSGLRARTAQIWMRSPGLIPPVLCRPNTRGCAARITRSSGRSPSP
jgi:hypothetical protein